MSLSQDLTAFLVKIRPALDKARAFADKADAAINKVNSSFGGALVKVIPGMAGPINDLILGCTALTAVLDAIDNAVDQASKS